MSEHEHEYKLDVKGNFYYCECGKSDLTIESLMVGRIACIERQAREEDCIKALEGVVEAARNMVAWHTSDGMDRAYEILKKALVDFDKLEEV